MAERVTNLFALLYTYILILVLFTALPTVSVTQNYMVIQIFIQLHTHFLCKGHYGLKQLTDKKHSLHPHPHPSPPVVHTTPRSRAAGAENG